MMRVWVGGWVGGWQFEAFLAGKSLATTRARPCDFQKILIARAPTDDGTHTHRQRRRTTAHTHTHNDDGRRHAERFTKQKTTTSTHNKGQTASAPKLLKEKIELSICLHLCFCIEVAPCCTPK